MQTGVAPNAAPDSREGEGPPSCLSGPVVTGHRHEFPRLRR
jgi:hypothetical protein